MLVFERQHSAIQVGVSYKQNVTFPDDPELGRCLLPGNPLSVATLAAYDVDPNAEVLLAQEALRQPRPEASGRRAPRGLMTGRLIGGDHQRARAHGVAGGVD